MKVLDHLAQAAAVLLLVELLVVLIIFLALAGGLAFGLHWVRGKTDWAFDKANAFLPQITHYVHTGTDYAAKPVIVASGFSETIKGTRDAVRNRVRSARSASSAPPVAVVTQVSTTTTSEEAVTEALPHPRG